MSKSMKPRGKKGGIAQANPLFMSLGVVSESFVTSEDESKDWYVEGFASTGDTDLGQYAPPTAKVQAGIKVSEAALNDLVEWSKLLPTVFRNHDTNEEIGRIVESAVKEGKYWVKVRISKTRPDIWQKVQEGVLSKFSVSFLPQEEKNVREAGTGKMVRLIERLVGLETSLVGLPRNPFTNVNHAYAASFAAGFANDGEDLEDSMTKVELVAAIKERLAVLPGLSGDELEEKRGEINDMYQRLLAIDPTVPNPLAGGEWSASAEVAEATPPAAPEVPVSPADAPATPTAEIPAVVEAPVAAAPEVAAVAAVVAEVAATPAEPKRVSRLEVMGEAVSQMLGGFDMEDADTSAEAVTKDLKWLDSAFSKLTKVSDEVKAKAREHVAAALQVIAEAMTPPAPVAVAQSAQTSDLGAVMQMFEAKFAEMAKAQAELAAQTNGRIEDLQKELIKKAEALGTLEKQNAELQKVTVSGPHGAPAAVPAAPREKTVEELRKEAWGELRLFPGRR